MEIDVPPTLLSSPSSHIFPDFSKSPDTQILSPHIFQPERLFLLVTFIKRWHLREKIRPVCSKSPPLGWWAAFLKVNILSYQECPHPFQLQRWEAEQQQRKGKDSVQVQNDTIFDRDRYRNSCITIVQGKEPKRYKRHQNTFPKLSPVFQ